MTLAFGWVGAERVPELGPGGPEEDAVGFELVDSDATRRAPATLVLIAPASHWDRAVVVARAPSSTGMVEEQASIAHVLFGLPPARFHAGAPRGADDAAVAAYFNTVTRASFAPPGAERVRQVIRRMRALFPDEPLVWRPLHEGAMSLYEVTGRDLKSGLAKKEIRGPFGPSMIDRGSGRALLWEAFDGFGSRGRQAIEARLQEIEQESGRPCRLIVSAEEDPEILAIRSDERAGPGAIQIALERHERGEGLDLRAVREVDVTRSLTFEPDPEADGVYRVIAAAPGIAEGVAALSAEEAASRCRAGEPFVYFVHDLVAEDAELVRRSSALVSVRGGITGEAAVMARALGKPCVASGPTMTIVGAEVRIAHAVALHEGETVTVDGAQGLLIRGRAAERLTPEHPSLLRLFSAIDGSRVAVRLHDAREVALAASLLSEVSRPFSAWIHAKNGKVDGLAMGLEAVVTCEGPPPELGDVGARSVRWLGPDEARAWILAPNLRSLLPMVLLRQNAKANGPRGK